MTPDEFEELTGIPLADTANECHAASHALVRALGRGRVARGTCEGVGAQHSWVVDGDDCYAQDARIIDPTLWCWNGDDPYVWTGTARDGLHVPHGHGSIWNWGAPPPPEDTRDVIPLAVDTGEDARAFLDFAAPHGLDRKGWDVLLHSPVEGWPAAAIVEAAYNTPSLRVIIPIDIVGMLTELNPGGVYR